MNLNFIACVGIASLILAITANARPENILMQEYFDKLASLRYNPNIPPTGNKGYGSPVHVLATMYVIDVHKIDDFSMDYRATFYFRQSWNDSRLAYDDMDISSIILNDAKQIWTPDLFFVQQKDGVNHYIISPNVFLRISPEGEVKYSVKLSVTFSCSMDFRKFPHDVHECLFSVESYGKTREKLLLDWDNRTSIPVSKTEKINVLPFELSSIGYSSSDINFTFGEYRALEVTLTFKRKIGFFMTRLYIPFIILVVLSWFSFWIKAKQATLRLSFLLVILYLMVTIGSDINSYIPPAPYTKASDVWIAVCESLVFGAFLEFLIVSVLVKSEKKMKKSRCTSDVEAPIITGVDSKDKPPLPDKKGSVARVVALQLSHHVKASKRVNAMASIVFPVLFIVFNFLYFLIY